MNRKMLLVALSAVAGTGIFLAFLGLAYMYSGLYNVAADSPDSALIDWILITTRERSLDSRVGDVKLPGPVEDIPTAEGFRHYHEMCEKCHGAPGVKPTDLRQGLNPKPPDLHKAAEDMTPQHIFWVAKHGIKMSAMPSFGRTHSDLELLPVVAFVNRLPKISAAEYAALLKSEGGKGP